MLMVIVLHSEPIISGKYSDFLKNPLQPSKKFTNTLAKSGNFVWNMALYCVFGRKRLQMG